MSWLNPMNRMTFQKAFKAEKTYLKFSDTEEYSLNYTLRKGYVWVQRIHAVSLAPCGWFDLKEVLKPDWIIINDSR